MNDLAEERKKLDKENEMNKDDTEVLKVEELKEIDSAKVGINIENGKSSDISNNSNNCNETLSEGSTCDKINAKVTE